MQTELHRHLDVSLRMETLLELAKERGLTGQSTSLEAFRDKIVLKKPLTDLKAVIETFEIFQKVQDRPEVLERVAFEAVEDCHREGTRKLELRFSPSFVSQKSGMHWDEVLTSFERGVSRAKMKYADIQVGLLCIATREFGFDLVDQTVDFFLKHQSRFVGLDLAGDEAKSPCRAFEKAFAKARAKRANITIHAGEAAGPENVWEAIECLGARRIGHGIASARDPQLIEKLRKDGICLETCPTSNWITRAVPSLEKHPLPALLRAGVPVSLNTDDPSVFGNSIPHEIEVCRKMLKMTEAEIQRCFEHASKASFIAS